jgi:hypothetical protein
VKKVVNIYRFVEQRVFCHVAATWPKHQSGISRYFYDTVIFVVSSFSSRHAYYVGTDPLLTSWNIISNFPFKFIFLFVDLEIMFVSVGNTCNINFLLLSRISHSFTDYPFTPSNRMLWKILATPPFYFHFKVSSNTRETCMYVLPKLFILCCSWF